MKAYVTAVLVDYADLNSFVRKQFPSPGWRATNLGDLQT